MNLSNKNSKSPLLALLNSKRLVVPEADPPMAENFPENRLASPRSGRANDFIS
jgi:hypothetical protein